MGKNGNSPLLQVIGMTDDLTSNRGDPKECCHVPLEQGHVARDAIPAMRQAGIDMVNDMSGVTLQSIVYRSAPVVR